MASQTRESFHVQSSQINGHSTPGTEGGPHLPDSPNPSPTSPLTGLLLISAIFIPISFLPYVVLRRHLLRLNGNLDKLAAATTEIRHELSTARLQLQLRNEELSRMRGDCEHLKTDINHVRDDFQGDHEQVVTLKSEIQKLREHTILLEQRHGSAADAQDSRMVRTESEINCLKTTDSIYTGSFKELGISLANIAAVLHEIDVQLGPLPGRGDEKSRRIEALRSVALKLQNPAGVRSTSKQ